MVETLKGAIDYADKGYPISPILSTLWQNAFNYFKRSMKDEMFNNWAKVFAHEGRAPRVGEIWRSPDHVKTLQEIAETNGESFYRGKIAELIAQASAKDNGFLTADDLASLPDWVERSK